MKEAPEGVTIIETGWAQLTNASFTASKVDKDTMEIGMVVGQMICTLNLPLATDEAKLAILQIGSPPSLPHKHRKLT